MLAMSLAHGVSLTPLTKGTPHVFWNWSVTEPSGPSSVAMEFTDRPASSTQ